MAIPTFSFPLFFLSTFLDIKSNIIYIENEKLKMSSAKSDSFLSDFGINSAEVLSKAIGDATKSDWKHNHSIPETILSNSIVLSASLFGSIYLFSTSLIGFDKKWIKDDQYRFGTFDVVNGTVMVFSGLVMVGTSMKAFAILTK